MKPLPIILEDLNKHLTECYSDDPTMRYAARKMLCKVIKESNQPLTGIYWYIPIPPKKPHQTNKYDWDIIEFYDSHYNGSTMHDERWNEVLTMLAHRWNRNEKVFQTTLDGCYSALPRGRVNKIVNGWTLCHGDNMPGFEKPIINLFNLQSINAAGKLRIIVDEHEQILGYDLKRFQAVMGLKFNLKYV